MGSSYLAFLSLFATKIILTRFGQNSLIASSVLKLFVSDSAQEAAEITEAFSEQQYNYRAVHSQVVFPVFSRPSSIQSINSRLGLVLAGGRHHHVRHGLHHTEAPQEDSPQDGNGRPDRVSPEEPGR